MNLKKICSLGLLVCNLLLLTLTGCDEAAVADLAEQAMMTTGEVSAASAVTQEGAALSEKTINTLQRSDMMIRFISYTEVGGQEIANEIVFAKQNGYSMTMLEHEGRKVRIVQTEAGTFAVIEETQQVIDLSVVDETIADYETPEFIGVNFLETGTAAIMGQELPYDAYTLTGGTIRYYYANEKLLYMELRRGQESPIVMEVQELVDKAPPALFELP